MKHFYFFFLTFFCLSASAEGMLIKGVIRDMDSDLPVKGVFVHFTFYQGFEFSSVTDSLGKFEIKTTALVPDGYYPGELKAQGYYDLYGSFLMKKETTMDQKIKRKLVKDTAAVAVKPVPKPVLEGYATNNLVFLIDISSSMNEPEKMPLLKASLKYLVDELRPTDRIAILTFSSNVKEALPSTPASDKSLIISTIDGLSFGSQSYGGAALDMAYKTAQKYFVPNGNNRVILASDGMFTSGDKDYKKMGQIIEAGLDKKIALSIFCFGKNTAYVNEHLKKLASSGNGNFAMITNEDTAKQSMILEAQAVKN